MLLIAVLAVSSNGTALHLLYGVPAPLKLFWRMTVTCGLLSLFAGKSCVCNKTAASLSWAQWNLLILAALCFCAHTLLLYTALEYTTIGNALIYANSQALLLIVGKAVVGEPVTPSEGLGVVTAFTGAILCSRDSQGQAAADAHDEHTPATALYGDALALASAVAGVAYLTLAKAVRPHLSVTVFMFLITMFGSGMVLAYLYCCSDVPVTWDRQGHTGLLGWLTLQDHHVWILLHIAVVCNVCGTMGFVRALQHFDTILIAVATLMEPMIASCIAFVFRVGLLPGPLGYLGNALVTAGTLAVVASSAAKQKQQQLQQQSGDAAAAAAGH
jgi:drug/metabolite transporter (DMT)-like permease